MREQIAANWWVLAVRGALAVILGIIAFAAPGAALTVLVTFFGHMRWWTAYLRFWPPPAGIMWISAGGF